MIDYDKMETQWRKLVDKYGLYDWRLSYENLQNGHYESAHCIGYTDFPNKTIRICDSKPRQFRQTLLHEIAHVLRGLEGGHDAEWLDIAHKIGCTFGHLLPYARALQGSERAHTVQRAGAAAQ
jgi:hypothetical protein